ncbi:MAG TPA: globin family protein [Chloroflexia bacterium]|jgi:nitric oxide dioxygenase
MTPEKIHLVQSTFEQVLPIADAIMALFYSRLFELDPRLRSLFHGDLQERGHKFMAMLHLAVANLSHPDTVVPMLHALGRRHSTYGVTDLDYDTMSDALLWTLERSLGPAFTHEAQVAWTDFYTTLTDTMKAAAQPPVLNPLVM